MPQRSAIASTKVTRGGSPQTAAVGLFLLHATLVVVCISTYSFAYTEAGLLPSGIADWRYGNFDAYRVNPPLLRMWGTWPLVLAGVDFPYQGAVGERRFRVEWSAAEDFIATHRERSYAYLAVARLMCLPFALLGAWVAYRWASALFSPAAGVGAMFLWAFLPMMIGYSGLIAGDAQAAAMGLAAFYVFRQWLRTPNGAGSYTLGVAIGVAVLTKFSWLLLFGLVPLLWLAVRCGEWIGSPQDGSQPLDRAASRGGIRALAREGCLMAVSLILALLIINLAYGFQGSWRRLGSYDFISRALSEEPGKEWQDTAFSGNRFRDHWLGRLPVPLPESMVLGIDLQKWDFDRDRWSYLRGEWRDHGWWYYYLYGLALKLPLGFWALAIVAAVGAWRYRRWRAPWQEELLLLAPLGVILALASLETGLNRHVRYVLPIVPFSVVLLSRAFLVFRDGGRVARGLVTLSSVALAASSCWIYPHSLAYFNELIGGPRHGIAHMNASNLDWGQDLQYLRRWCQAHPEARPLFVKYYPHAIPPAYLGIPQEGMVPVLAPGRLDNTPFRPGWYVIDQESLIAWSPDGHSGYEYLRDFTPIAHVGYSFQVFHVDASQARRLSELRASGLGSAAYRAPSHISDDIDPKARWRLDHRRDGRQADLP